MRTRRDAIPRRRTQGPTRWPPSSPETGTRVSEKGVSAQGRKRPRQPPTVWERSGPVARARPWPHEACPAGGTWSCSAGSGQRGPAAKTHVGDARRQRPRKEALQHVWGQEGAGSQSGEEQQPPWSSVRVWTLYLWAPFALEFSSTVPWPGSGAGGYVGPGSRTQGLGQAGVTNQTDM